MRAREMADGNSRKVLFLLRKMNLEIQTINHNVIQIERQVEVVDVRLDKMEDRVNRLVVLVGEIDDRLNKVENRVFPQRNAGGLGGPD